jgi:hypothetical protein
MKRSDIQRIFSRKKNKKGAAKQGSGAALVEPTERRFIDSPAEDVMSVVTSSDYDGRPIMSFRSGLGARALPEIFSRFALSAIVFGGAIRRRFYGSSFAWVSMRSMRFDSRLS